jgi:hypothetical protein
MRKKAILHRKNALFYKTMNGARAGDLFMSLIHTCELNKVEQLKQTFPWRPSGQSGKHHKGDKLFIRVKPPDEDAG